MNITFAGTPEFGRIILEKIINKGIKISSVVTVEDVSKSKKKKTAPSPVKSFALERNIPVYYKLSDIIDKTDLVIVAAYGKIISKDLLEKPKYQFLNVHPSLLPKYRGPSPIQQTILNGDTKAGVSIIVMDEKIDHGPILAQHQIEIEKPYYQELENKLANIAGEILPEIIDKWTKKEIIPIPQKDELASFCKIIKKEDGKINWTSDAEKIERKIRALNPWPGSYTFLDQKMLKIFSGEICENTQENNSPGKIKIENHNFLVKTANHFLSLKKIQLSGKKPTSAKDFLQGNSDISGKVLK